MKMLKTKHFRRIVVFLAMIAPVVYLFGSLFAGLTGAHGEQVFADDAYPYEWAEVEEPFTDGADYRLILSVDDSSGVVSALGASNENANVCTQEVYINGVIRRVSYGRSILAATSSGSNRFLYSYPSDVLPWPLVTDNGYFNYSLPWVFTGSLSALNEIHSFFGVGTWERLSEKPQDVAFSDYVFGQFFDKDNFLLKIGEDVMSDTPHGFVPFASFWKYLDENMLHMGDMQLGLMGYGYVYYCCHVLLFDIAFILVTFFLDFIQKVNDKVVGGVD